MGFYGNRCEKNVSRLENCPKFEKILLVLDTLVLFQMAFKAQETRFQTN